MTAAVRSLKGMRAAVMQPYFWPYRGYFDLIQSVDVFVFLTDVQYKRGWMNRNRIRSGESWQYITVPVQKHRQTAVLNSILVHDSAWHETLCRTLLHVYGKKIVGHPLWLSFSRPPERLLCDLAVRGVRDACDFLGLRPAFLDSSAFPSKLRGADRIISLCKRVGATTYVNLPGGIRLYDESLFKENGLRLEFTPSIKQSDLSILDLCLGDGLEFL